MFTTVPEEPITVSRRRARTRAISLTRDRTRDHYVGPMFRHTVMFRWSAASTVEQRSALDAALGQLPAAIPEIRRYHFGPDAGINEGNLDFAVVADFDDVDGYLVYRDHPEHGRVITELIVPFIDSRAAVQYDLGG